MKVFSQRKAKPPERFIYEFPKKARARIFHTLRQLGEGGMSGRFDFVTMLRNIGERSLTIYGRLCADTSYGVNEQKVAEHFWLCPDDEGFDFIEMCFQTSAMNHHDMTRGVAKINEILEEEGIGYELEPPKLGDINGYTFLEKHPRLIPKGDPVVHEQAVKPALQVLGDPRMATANAEIRDAFDKMRKQKWDDAITSCGAAYESVMRTICDVKGWTFDPQKETCATLVEICRVNNLFEPFYVEGLRGPGMVRNKLGDAHGKAGSPYVTTRNHAEHMLALTCSNIVFLTKQAGF